MNDDERSEELQEIHNRAQSAAADGESFDLPHNSASILAIRILDGEDAADKLEEENAAYLAGWENGKNQD
jgi:hypothetical protein